jgi:hypothetical protein
LEVEEINSVNPCWLIVQGHFSLSCLQDNTYDPIPDFEFLLSRFTEKPIKEEILCQMGSFYLFIKDDLAGAYRKYWSEVISQNPESEKLKVCNI